MPTDSSNVVLELAASSAHMAEGRTSDEAEAKVGGSDSDQQPSSFSVNLLSYIVNERRLQARIHEQNSAFFWAIADVLKVLLVSTIGTNGHIAAN